MSYEDNFNIKNNSHNNYYRRHNHHQDYDHHDSFVYSPPSKIHYAGYILKKIWGDRKLRIFFLLSLILLKVIIIGVVLLLIPVIGDLTDLLKQEGLKGIIGTVAGLLNKLWTGA